MIKDLKRVGLSVLFATLLQLSAFADDAWDKLIGDISVAPENSTVNVTSDVQSDSTTIGVLQKVLNIDFNNHKVKGSQYSNEAPFTFIGSGASETQIAIMNATFSGFDVGDNGIINGVNPYIELTDVSLVDNIGRAINNTGYNKFAITAQNSDVKISNTYNGNGVLSNSSIYLNAYDGKTLQIDDDIKIDSTIDGNLLVNNTFKRGCDLNGTVILNGKLDIPNEIILGSGNGYKNGTLKLGATPANSTNFKLNVGGEAILDLQNNNVDTLKMGKLSGNDDTSLHLKLDYNAETGKMDVINVGNNAVSASMPSLIVDEINILVGGNAHNTQYLSGNGIDLLKISKDTLSAVKDGTTYVFRPDSTKGSYIVSKAKNINNTDSLNHFIMNVPQANDNDIAITEDMTFSTMESNNLAGADRESTIFGNGHTIFSSAGNNGRIAQVNGGQTLNFNNITLKSFYNDVLVSRYVDGTVNFTSVTLDNSGFMDNNGTLNLYGENNFIGPETRIGTTSSDTLIGTINILSGTTTNAGERMTAKFLNIGSSDTDAPRVTFNNSTSVTTDKLTVINANVNNSGTLINKTSTYTPTIKNAYIYNTGTMEFETLDNSDSTIKNDGTFKISNILSFEVSSSTTFENDENGIFEGGAIANSGTIINKGQINSGITNYDGSSLTSNIDNIRDDVQLIQGSKFYITGGSFSSSNNDKIKGQGGDIYITDKVNVAADVIQENFSGKTTVQKGAELVVSSVFDPAQDNKLFSKGDLVFEDNSTLNLKDCYGHGGGTIVNDNISNAVGDTLNLKINDSTKLKFQGDVKGNLGISELELKLDNPTSWTLIDGNDLANRTAFTNNFKLIKINPNAQDINLVWYDNSTGNINLDKNQTLQSVINMIATTNPSKDYFYEMIGDEELDKNQGRSSLYDDSSLVVQGNNKTLNFKNDYELTIGDQGKHNKVVFSNVNLEDAILHPDSDGQLVINNESGKAITLNNTTIDDRSQTNGGTYFKGNSDINFNGEYKAFYSNAKAHVDLNGAALTRNGIDENANWYLHSGTLKYKNDSDLANGGNNSIYFSGGNLDLRNGIASEIPLSTIGLTANSNIYVDVDLANKTMDKLTANSSSYTSGKLNVAGMTLLSDAIDDFTTINFTNDADLMMNVEYTGSQGVAYSPIYKYNVLYNNTTGDFQFLRNDFSPSGNPSEAFNPAILATSVAAQVGAYLTQLNTYEQAFANQDMLMSLTNEQRTAMKFANKLASIQGTGEGGVVTFSPNQIPEQDKGLWFRPFATFENVGLKNGPNVKNIGYGSLVGGDSGIIELKRGWDAVYSGYVGYNGSNQYYDGVSVTQNGGIVGLSGIWYKNNFFTGLTANVGASVGESSTMFGNDEFAMLSTGVASKTGYNWELADGKFIVQPNFLMSYTFVNTFDYTNSAGVKIKSDPLHAIQIAPGLKFIGNLKNGWQPYVSLQMVWNLIDKTKFMANEVSLPEMSVKPYFQYGLGVQKRVGERFTGYGQAMIRNGGRNGIALQFGFRWALGK